MRSSSRVSARMASRAATCSGSFLSTLASNASSARRSSSRFSFRTDPPKRSGLRETPEAGRGAIFAGRGARGARSGARESGAFGASRRAARGIGARAGVRERRTRRGRRLVSQPARGVADTAPHTCERPRVQSSTDRGRASRGARFDLSRVVLLAPARTRPGAPGSCDRARSRTPVVATPPRARFRAPSSPTRAERPRGARVVGRGRDPRRRGRTDRGTMISRVSTSRPAASAAAPLPRPRRSRRRVLARVGRSGRVARLAPRASARDDADPSDAPEPAKTFAFETEASPNASNAATKKQSREASASPESSAPDANAASSGDASS